MCRILPAPHTAQVLQRVWADVGFMGATSRHPLSCMPVTSTPTLQAQLLQKFQKFLKRKPMNKLNRFRLMDRLKWGSPAVLQQSRQVRLKRAAHWSRFHFAGGNRAEFR
jgi:hypothetical protein